MSEELKGRRAVRSGPRNRSDLSLYRVARHLHLNEKIGIVARHRGHGYVSRTYVSPVDLSLASVNVGLVFKQNKRKNRVYIST